MKPVRGVRIPVDGRVVPVTVGTLDEYQAAVGGDLELVELNIEGYHASMYLNENGKIDGLPVNPVAWFLASTFCRLLPGDFIVGDVLVLGPVDRAGNDTNLDARIGLYIAGHGR